MSPSPTFYLQVYRDVPDAVECLTSIRTHYRDARVIVISDGDDDPVYQTIADSYACDYRRGKRLYELQFGGQMIQRMLESFLEEPSELLIKLDTDSRVHRQLQCHPSDRAVYGTLEHRTTGCNSPLDPPNVQGGCMIFPRSVAEEIVQSKRLLSPDLVDFRNTYADTTDIRGRAEEWGMISMDFVTRYVCKELGIPPAEHPEVRSLYRGTVAIDGEGFAITHPHKNSCQ